MKPFEPSCGMEAVRIYELCEHCERDRATWPIEQGGQDDYDNGCPILVEWGMNGRHPMVKITDTYAIHCDNYVPEGQEIFVPDTKTLELRVQMTNISDILQEQRRARRLHSWEGYSILDKVAVLANEAGEALREAVKIRQGEGDMARLRTEIIQSAAMALRCLEGLEIK